MKRVCIYHAGCPDGLGAAWAAWRVWGDSARYIARGHDDPLSASDFDGALVAFVDISPPNDVLRELAGSAAQLVILDHHVSARDRFETDLGLTNEVQGRGHHIHFDMDHSGAVLSWNYFHPDEPTPDLLGYVEDQDLWNWKLPHSREVNAAIGSHPLSFPAWDQLAATPVEKLAEQGASIVRAQKVEVERVLKNVHPVWIGKQRVEAVNAVFLRSWIGHELAGRARYGAPCGLVYRLNGRQVDISIYSIGDFNVAEISSARGGGGHRNAAGFSVPLERWIEEYL